MSKKEFEQAVATLDKNEGGDCLIIEVVMAAQRYWEGISGDFCVQHVGSSIVFGGTNRLIYSPFYGFRPDRSSCTEKFLANCDRLGPFPRRENE